MSEEASMLETLKERKEALEAQGKKGFTLMEMLIAIAVSGVGKRTEIEDSWSGMATELPFQCYEDPGAPTDGIATFKCV